MTASEYLVALYAAGISKGLPVGDLDRKAAALLKIDARTARRYRRGEIPVPGPVEVVLDLLSPKAVLTVAPVKGASSYKVLKTRMVQR